MSGPAVSYAGLPPLCVLVQLAPVEKGKEEKKNNQFVSFLNQKEQPLTQNGVTLPTWVKLFN